MWKDDFKFLTLLSTKLQNTSVPNSLDKLIQLTSMEPHIYDLDRGKITDLDKFLKKQHSIVLNWCNLTIWRWSKIDRGFMTFSTSLLLPFLRVTFSGLLDTFHGQRNLKIFYKKLKKEPILSGYYINRYKRFFYVTNSGLFLSWVTLQYHFVSSITSDYNINSKKWDLDIPKCFNFYTKWHFSGSLFDLRWPLMGYIQDKDIVTFTLVKISE